MNLKTIQNEDFTNKRVIVRVDYNVPLKNNEVKDNTRIKRSLDTIKLLNQKGAKIILMSHLGRPKGIDESLRLNPVKEELQKLLNESNINLTVIKFDDCIGEDIKNRINNSNEKEIFLLENLRFHKEEKENDDNFAKQLSELADCYVSDAFGTVHRAHASTQGISKYIPSFAGLLVEAEVKGLSPLVEEPNRPFVAIIGCAKIKDKLNAVKFLLQKADKVIFGGAIVFSFFKANGLEIGKSICEEDLTEIKQLIADYGNKIVLPTDIVVADNIESPTKIQTVNFEQMPSDLIGVDVGEQSIILFKETIKEAKTICWNGPLGIFEKEEFAKGTNEFAKYLATKKDAYTVIGGGDTVSAVKPQGVENFTHVSTGGGAFLEFLEGKVLPGIEILLK
ncbi:phosphoglycerate kinase [Candidatus Woesearchaeota archaeon]|nr:phosphoglycerate kinase [Candidatus Woesearchaeota archaeon]